MKVVHCAYAVTNDKPVLETFQHGRGMVRDGIFVGLEPGDQGTRDQKTRCQGTRLWRPGGSLAG